ncbi:MAG: hypothetical protein V9E90_13915 [Saprospiraceae bacterium]|jgi:hypothetical protein
MQAILEKELTNLWRIPNGRKERGENRFLATWNKLFRKNRNRGNDFYKTYCHKTMATTALTKRTARLIVLLLLVC